MKKNIIILIFTLLSGGIFAQQSAVSPKGELHIPLPTSWTNTSPKGEIHILGEEDKLPPTISLNHNYYEEVSENNFTIKGIASDQSGIKEVLLDGKKIGKNSFSKNVLLAVGTNKFILKAIDNRKNSTEKEITIVYTKKEIVVVEPKDNKDPIILLNHGTNISSEKKEFTISGTASDESGINNIFLSGDAKDYTQNSKFNFNVVLKEGENIFTIKAEDKEDNEEEVKIIITYNPQRKDYALIFYVSDYKGSGMANLSTDKNAKQLEVVLKNDYGFETHVFANYTATQIEDEIKKQTNKNYNDNDQLLIYFSGYGSKNTVRNKTTGNLLCANKTKMPHASFTTFSIDNNCNHILLVLDACYSGYSLYTGIGDDVPDYKENKEEYISGLFTEKPALHIFTSGDKEGTIKKDGLSDFTKALIEILKYGKGKHNILTDKEIINKIDYDIKAGKVDISDNPKATFLFIKK